MSYWERGRNSLWLALLYPVGDMGGGGGIVGVWCIVWHVISLQALDHYVT